MQEREESRELAELRNLYHSQQAEIGEMREKLSRFMTKGAPVVAKRSTPPTKQEMKKKLEQVVMRRSSLARTASEDSKTELVVKPHSEAAAAAPLSLQVASPPAAPKQDTMSTEKSGEVIPPTPFTVVVEGPSEPVT